MMMGEKKRNGERRGTYPAGGAAAPRDGAPLLVLSEEENHPAEPLQSKSVEDRRSRSSPGGLPPLVSSPSDTGARRSWPRLHPRASRAMPHAMPHLE